MVELRPFAAADAPRLLEWVDGPQALVLWSGKTFTWPLDAGQLLADAAGAGPKRRLWSGLEAASGAMVGHVTLAVDPAYEMGRLARVIVAPDARGRGVGAAMVRAVLAITFEELRLHRVTLGVFTHNAGAIRLYERLGFVREGLFREVARWTAAGVAI